MATIFPRRFVSTLIGLTAILATPCAAETENLGAWALCGKQNVIIPEFFDHSRSQEETTFLAANQSESLTKGWHWIKGDVTVQRGVRWLSAEEAIFDQGTNQLDAIGNVRLGDLNLSTFGSSAQFNLDTEQGHIVEGGFFIGNKHGRGESELIILSSRDLLQLSDATYTSCDEGDNDWYLHAKSIKLDYASGFGSASSVYVTFYRVPILFSPYLTFPISDQRKSGFLAPNISNSFRSGTEISAPYYLNLAPNYDATIIPRNMTRRGLLVEGEFRYLSPHSQGMVQGGYLAGDNHFGDDRRYVSFNHASQPLAGLSTQIELNYLSDVEYFNDFGGSVKQTNITHLDQILAASYSMERSAVAVMFKGFQTVNKNIPKSARPYRQLPQILFNYRSPFDGSLYSYDIEGEMVAFDQDNRLTGQRLDLSPSFSLPFSRYAGFFIPKVTLRHTQYHLDSPTAPTPPTTSRTLPIATLDTGIFLDRNFFVGDRPLLQTLEPRLFYVYTPYKDQSDLPVFDTGVTNFGFSQLFRTDRFSGADRVGDANQVTAALTTRFIDLDSGIEHFRASVGQIFYRRDRVVNIDRRAPETTSQSDIVAEFVTQLGSLWTAKGDLIWNHINDEIDEGAFSTQLKLGPRRIFNASYRYNREGILEQDEYSFIWQLSRRWMAFGMWNYSHPDDLSLESFGGLEYSSCCWALRLVQRRNHLSLEEGYDVSTMVQLELKGLANVGNPVESVIEDGVPGFSAKDSSFSFQ